MQRRRVVDRRSSGDQVASYIRGLIFDGKLRQGAHIRQDDIAEELGVSRIPVREAIIALDCEGWVTIEPHRGAFVHGFDENVVRDHYDILGMLYGLAARRATERASDEQVEQLGEAQRSLSVAENPDDVFQANEEFQRELFAMAKSARLASFSRLMTGVIPGNVFERIPGLIDTQKRGTAAIFRAIRSHDAEQASSECAEMLRSQGDRVVALLQARHVFQPPPAGD